MKVHEPTTRTLLARITTGECTEWKFFDAPVDSFEKLEEVNNTRFSRITFNIEPKQRTAKRKITFLVNRKIPTSFRCLQATLVCQQLLIFFHFEEGFGLLI